jgi:hypothetical protein
MLPFLPEGHSVTLAQQQQQMHSGKYTSYTLPPGSVFTTIPSSTPQQQQQQQRAFMNGNSVLIDPSTTFFVQQQQQRTQTLLSYSNGPQGGSIPAGMSPFSNAHPNSIPVYTTATSVEASPFASALSMTSSNPAARTQRMGSTINSAPSQPPPQQQQQRLQPVFLRTTSTTNSPPMTPPYHQKQQQQQQRCNSISINSAQYSPLTRQIQAPMLSSTPPSSTHGRLSATPQLFSTRPRSPLPSSSGGLQLSHGAAAAAPLSTTSASSFAYSTPPSSVTQYPQQLVTGGTTAGVTDVLNSFSTATTSAPAAASTQSNSTTNVTAAAVGTVDSGVVDAEEMRQANERPFRFKMLPPPPTFDRFLLQWEANAADAHYRPWRRSDGSGNLHGDFGERVGVLTEEDVLQRSAVAATATVVATASSGNGHPNGAATLRTAEERLALAEQYRRILERWWYYMSVFEQKAEVRQRLGSLYSCPDYADAQRAVAAGFAELLPGELREQLTPDEVALQTWSHLVLKWWEETKRRRRTRRSRRGSRKDASSSSAAGQSARDGSQADGDATPPQMENDEETSMASGNSFGMPSTEGSRRTHSLPDNEGYLNFDFTNQTTFGSPAESG